jgi:hypothetical protein|tara:strand:- start:514 stop:669 length:156 start_codon:yes stop_codon:yes gene_type:complete
MFDKFVRRMGMKTETGWDDPTVVGFIVLSSVFGYGTIYTILELIKRFYCNC